MKFLCIPCDTPMKLDETVADDKGSISLRYACEECGYEMAMLTNPFETQLVSSLGVQVGPQKAEGASAGAGKCPFTGMVQAMQPAAQPQAAPAAPGEDGFAWTPDARQRLAQLPDFVRPMAKTGIEKWAQEKGYPAVDGKVLDEAKDFFGM